MAKTKRSFPAPLTILMVVIVLAAVCTLLLPAGQYSKLSVNEGKSFTLTSPSGDVQLPLTQQTLDSLKVLIPLEKFTNGDIRKPVSVPGSYQVMEKNPQGILQILQAPIKGIMESIDIALFVLIMGGFMFIFNETGAIVKGITALSHSMKGREQWLLIILTLIFSFLGSSYGMAEETLVFYPLLVPLFMAAGYDLLVPVAIIFGGSTIGWMSSFSNPFSTIIASNAAGINWMDGLYERLLMFVISTGILLWYILRYAAKVKKDPSASLVYKVDGNVKPLYDVNITKADTPPSLDLKTKLLLFLYMLTFFAMIGGVVFLGWWTLEMSVLFVASSILVGLIVRMPEKVFVQEFIKGAESLLSVAFIIGVARGVTIVLNEGMVSDSILYYAAGAVQGISPALFILALLAFYFFFTLFISSASGLAVLTMPIIGALAIIVNIPGKEIVNSYLFGMTIMQFITPTGMILPSLALANVSLKAWMKFITPFLIILTIVCSVFLVVGIYFG